MLTELRPHHLLCVQKFTGHGYDETFISHMYHLKWRLKGIPATPIKLIEGGDQICAVCPNRDGAVCRTHDKVKRMDEEILKACGLSYGDKGSWKELSKKAAAAVFETGEFERICGSCQWFELCKNTGKGAGENI